VGAEARFLIGRRGYIDVVAEFLNATLTREMVPLDCGQRYRERMVTRRRGVSQVLDSRTPLNRVASLAQSHLTNPNLFLIDALKGQTITRTTVIELSSDSSPAGSVPDVGGGVDNIAFLVGKGAPPAGGRNAVAPKVTAIFWIEEGTDASGKGLLQLQYTQRVILDFAGLSWPHVSVATLRSE
jgi:hypothetical protein